MAERHEKSQSSVNRFNSISPAANVVLVIILVLVALTIIYPMVLITMVSFSTSESIALNGYTTFPEGLSLKAYEYLAKGGGTQILDSYIITIFYTITGTILSLIVMSMYAFVLANKNFPARKVYTFILFFTMLFSGGLVPTYIVNTRYLHLYDTIWVFLLPGLVSAYNVIILRTFINSSIPDALFEAARIDGATNFRIFFQIVLPLFKPGLATIGLFNVVARWNDWFTAVLYIENPKLVPLQTVLQRIQQNIQFIKNNSQLASSKEGQEMLQNMPTESTQMAILLIITIPILFAYPFFQRYFIQGLTIGSVKG